MADNSPKKDEDMVEDEDMPTTDGGAAKFAAVEVKSGEENYSIILKTKAKLLRFDEGENAWKERGQGDAKMLQSKSNPDQYMFIMRREGIGKLAAQHCLTKGMSIKVHQSSEKLLVWSSPADFADDENEGQPETFCIRFASKELADEFKTHFEAICAK